MIDINQSEDFIGVTIDSVRVEFDLGEAHETLVKIDFKHKDDPWKCLKCFGTFTRALDETSRKCLLCGAGPETESDEGITISRDESYLDDVVAYMKGKGYERISRRTADQFYNAINEAISGLKKKESPTPGLPFGMELTQPNGPAGENELTSNFSLG